MAKIRFSRWPTPVPAGKGTVLDAALAAGVPLPHACRAGECGQCKCRLAQGEVDHAPHAPEALSAAERADGLILACRARPRGDVEIAWRAANPVRRVDARVVGLDWLNHDIRRLRVAIDGAPLVYSAGQFARLSFAGQPPRAYSMATAGTDGILEFHIRRVPGGRVSGFVAEELTVGARVALEGPHGSACLAEDSARPLILVGGGSGLAPLLAIIEARLARKPATDIHLYHGVRAECDLYAVDRLGALAADGALIYRPVLANPGQTTALRTGPVHQAVGHDFASLAGYDLYFCGPPPMIEALHQLALERGASAEHIFADPFTAAAPAAARGGLLDGLRKLWRRKA